ncbi:hypothetical protein O6P43_026973 [Quillaja saponaria]|uniref:Uncharacterized protein n=1 Tax=Quillaja saponaria TaxID=32244 RepID=A0AAD7PDE3_QUISA|nr:hypothetical protein O6P43_026973 [Quillaja saponaria]
MTNDQCECIIDILENYDEAICIYRVPPNLRQVNAKAYTPQFISVGPFHHGKHELKAMEVKKKIYQHEFQKSRNLTRAFSEFKDYIEKTEGDIRRCYAAAGDSDSLPRGKEFVDMIELDAIFIMEFFLRSVESEKNGDEYKDDYVLSKPWLKKGIELDLILLENQIPFSILTELYTFVDVNYQQAERRDNITKDMAGGFLDLACEYFKHYCPVKNAEHLPVKEKEVRHLTDLIRSFYIPIELKSCLTTSPDDNTICSATELQEAGVTFKAVSDRCLLDIKFNKPKSLNYLPCLSFLLFNKSVKPSLELPKLTVESKTENVLQNLIALKQCHSPNHQYICNYIALIDGLIYSKEDLGLLLRRNVIVNRLGNHAAVKKMINSLRKEIVISSTCYQELITKLKGHHNAIWNRRMETLSSVYFRDLWRTSLTIVGLAVLAFTFIPFL